MLAHILIILNHRSLFTYNAPCFNFDEPVTSKAPKSSVPITHISTLIFTASNRDLFHGLSYSANTNFKPTAAYPCSYVVSMLLGRSTQFVGYSVTRSRGGLKPQLLGVGPRRQRDLRHFLSLSCRLNHQRGPYPVSFFAPFPAYPPRPCSLTLSSGGPLPARLAHPHPRQNPHSP